MTSTMEGAMMTEREGKAIAEIEYETECAEVAEALKHPDPNPDDLPAVIPAAVLQQEQTAAHILRASLRLHAEIEAMQGKMDVEMTAWAAEIGKLQAKRDAWRTMVRDWMLRTGTTQIKTPWLTASISKGRTRKVILDQAAMLARLREVGYLKAIKITESIVKAEADVAVDTWPAKFADLVKEETGEPGLSIRRKE